MKESWKNSCLPKNFHILLRIQLILISLAYVSLAKHLIIKIRFHLAGGSIGKAMASGGNLCWVYLPTYLPIRQDTRRDSQVHEGTGYGGLGKTPFFPQERVCCSSCWEYCQVWLPKSMFLLQGHTLPLGTYIQLLTAKVIQRLPLQATMEQLWWAIHLSMLLGMAKHCCIYTAV